MRKIMTDDDFHHVLRNQLTLIPASYRDRFADLVHRAIPRALEFGLGMRIFEEIYTDLCVEIINNCAGDEQVYRDVLTGSGHDR